MNRLLQVMQALRTPETGCPWDLKQSFESITQHTIEEAYEVKEAILNNDMPALKEELGDLLFQIVFYAQLAKENDLFDFNDICNTVVDKLIRRHPHVTTLQQFAEDDSDSTQHLDQTIIHQTVIDKTTIHQMTVVAAKLNQPDATIEVNRNWEAIKQQERESKSQHSLMDDIPIALPALMRAHKIQNRCKSVGFDWDNWQDVFAKVKEEINEVEDELIQPTISQDKLAEELGDLFFAMANLTRHLGFKSEDILDKANRKFMNRFRQVEAEFVKQNKPIQDASLTEMEAIWQQVKLGENKL